MGKAIMMDIEACLASS